MKRNILKRRAAILLASLMAFGAMPINTFAQPANNVAIAPMNFSVGTGRVADVRLSRQAITAPTRAAFVEVGTRTGTSGTVNNSNLIDNWVEGSNLHLVFNEDISNTTAPIHFTVDLENATWFFRDAGSSDTGNLDSPTFNPANGSWNAATNTYTRTFVAPRPDSRGQLQYTLRVSQADPSRATVTLVNIPETVSAMNKFKKNINAPAENPTEKQVPAEAEAPKPAEIIKPAKPEPEAEITKPTKSEKNKEKTAPVDAMSIIDDLAREGRLSMNRNAAMGRNDTNGGFAQSAYAAVVTARNYVTQAQGAVENAPYAVEQNIYDALSYVTEARGYIEDEDLASVEINLTTAYNELNEALTLVDTIYPATANPYGQSITPIQPATTTNDTTNTTPDITPDTTPNNTPNNTPNTTARINTNENIIPVASYATISPFNAVTIGNHLSAAYAALNTAATTLYDLKEGNGNGNGNGNGDTGTGVSITSGDHAVIPLVIRRLNDEDVTVRIEPGGTIPTQTHTLVVARGVTEGATRIVTRAVAVGRDRIELEPIGIFENRTGALPTSGQFEFVAPSGFHFASVNNVRVIPEGGFTGSGFNATISIVPNTDARTMRVVYTGLAPSTNLIGQLAVTGVVLLNSSVTGETVREGEITMQIRNVSGQPNVVTAQTFAVANVTDWRMNLTRIGDAPTLLNGRLNNPEFDSIVDEDHRAARVRVEEVIPNTWWAQRATTFNLPQGVRVRRAEFRNIRNIRNAEVLNGSFYNDRARSQSNSYVRITDSQIIISGLDVIPEQRASFEIELWVNVESGFEGDIDLTLGGSAVTGVANQPSIVIATAKNPIEITTDIRSVRMGYDFAQIGNFKIEETRAGALLGGEEVFISITDEHFTELQIAPGFRANVTEGDIRISNARIATHLGSLGRANQAWRIGANASFEIERESTVASTIEFTNVQARISPVMPIPAGRSDFNLVVWGPAVAANYEGIRDTANEDLNRHDFFNTPGLVERIVTGVGVGTSQIFTNVVRITANTPILLVNDEQMLMDTSAYISPRSNSMMIPVRFVAMALGLEAGRVLWSPETATVTIDAGERILQFRINSSVMLINGIEFPMLNAAGQPVFAEIRDERAFIPFRALSEALNVYVSWDAATSTATFDPRREADRAFHPEDLAPAQARNGYFGQISPYHSYPNSPYSYYNNNYNNAMY